MCTCGRTDLHVIAERRTFDGIRVCGWSDGEVTFGLGIYPQGIRRRRTRVYAEQIRDLVLEEVSLYDAAEVPALIRAAREAVAQASFPPAVYLRRRMAGEKFVSDGRVVRRRS